MKFNKSCLAACVFLLCAGCSAELIEKMRHGGFTLDQCYDGATARERQAIQDKKVFVGMSERAAICAWGAGRTVKINQTVTAYGVHKQIVFSTMRSGILWPSEYVYTEGGVVTSIQN